MRMDIRPQGSMRPRACSRKRAGAIRISSSSQAELPGLAGVAADSYDNVLCETVIMHLDRALIAPSVRRMFEIVKPGGVFYLSWRVTDAADLRDGHGRLYAAFDASIVRDELKAATTPLDEEVVSASSGKKIHRLVVKKK